MFVQSEDCALCGDERPCKCDAELGLDADVDPAYDREPEDFEEVAPE